MATSSTFRELLGVADSLKSFGEQLRGNTVSLYTDNQNVARIVKNGSTKEHLQTLAITIFQWTLQNNVILKVNWVPREQNTTADYFSKLTDTDDWSIDSETFDYIQQTFGIFTIDRFADNLNKRVDRFNSKFYCPATEHIDVFSTDWANEFNWLSPC